MSGGDEMPLQQVLQALSRTPRSETQLRAVLALTAARWARARAEDNEAHRLLGQALEMVADLRPAMRMLFRIYEQRGDVRSSVMYLDQEIRATRHPREAAALYRERGQLVEAHFRDLGAALQCYEAALKATPRDLAVLRSVERVTLARGDVFYLIANLEQQLEVLEEPAAVSGVLRDLALLETRHGGDLHLAGDMLLEALHQTPGHLGLTLDLFRVAELSGDAELMLQALEWEAEARPEGQRAMPLARASLVLREHRDRSAAAALLHAAALDQRDDVSLWRSLEELCMATSRYDMALEATLAQLRAMDEDEDPSARAELFFRAGRLALARLDRPAEGLAALRKAVRLFPSHIPALEEAARYLIERGSWSQLLELMKLQSSLAVQAGLTKAETAQTLLRAGQVYEERLHEPESARRLYEEAAQIAPRYRPARDRLERVLHQIADPEALKHFYREELEQTEEPARRTFLLSVLAQLHGGDGDPGTAIKHLVSVLKLRPDHVFSIQQLARLLSRAGRPKDVLRVTEKEIALTESPARKARLLHRSGELALQLGDRARARQLLSEALGVVDDHEPSLDALEQMLREDEDWPALLELLRTRLIYATDRGRQVALRLEMAQLLAKRLDEPAEALRELEQLLERWPRHLPALHAAEVLAARLGRWNKLVDLLERHVSSVQGPRTRALLLHRAATIRAGQLEDREAAIRDLVRALDQWPQLGVARALLLRLYEAMGRSRELQSFAEAGLTSERGTDDRRALALQLAELTPRPVAAIQYLGTVAEARPDDVTTQLRLARAARAARRASREAGALGASAQVVARGDAAGTDALDLRYRAARAEESAGNLDRADEGYAGILDQDPGHSLARRGRLRVKARKQDVAGGTRSEDLRRAAAEATTPAQRAAFAHVIAELHERRGDLRAALGQTDEAIEHRPDFIPALHARARILERIGGPENIEAAIATLERLAELQKVPAHRVASLARAGAIALRSGGRDQPNPDAWRLFAAAFALDPRSELALRGLFRTAAAHGHSQSPALGHSLRARIKHLESVEQLDVDHLRAVARLALGTDGPALAVELIELGLGAVQEDAKLYADRAQCHAQLEDWPAVVRDLETALSLEESPERRAALHFFVADAHEKAEQPEDAIRHYLAAGRGGFHPRHALLCADRLAASTGALEQRVEVLGLLIEQGDGEQRARSLRALADVYRGPLAQPETAVELMHELIMLEPTDLEAVTELHRLQLKLGQEEEATATLLAAVAQQRAWLRSQGIKAPDGRDEPIDTTPVRGLIRLFDLLGEPDGVYLGAAVLEVAAPDQLIRGRRCDDLVGEPWPLPDTREGRPFDHLVGDLPCSPALDLLHEGTFYLGHLPGAPPPVIDLAKTAPLPPTSGVVLVARALADTIGVPPPNVYLDPDQLGVLAYQGATPSLVVGRAINSAPFSAESRDRLGRALMRLATAGDFLREGATQGQLIALLCALCGAAGVELPEIEGADAEYEAEVRAALPSDATGLTDVCRAFARAIDGFDAGLLLEAMAMAEDRAGVIAAADPRATLHALDERGQLLSPRGTSLVGYLMSDDHLSLRRSLGYHASAVELELDDLEEVAT